MWYVCFNKGHIEVFEYGPKHDVGYLKLLSNTFEVVVCEWEFQSLSPDRLSLDTYN